MAVQKKSRNYVAGFLLYIDSIYFIKYHILTDVILVLEIPLPFSTYSKLADQVSR